MGEQQHRAAETPSAALAIWMTVAGFTAMTKPAMVFEEPVGRWGVEWFDDDGRREFKIFIGSDAHRQAL